MSKKDYYATLGVKKDANASEIKSAFRKMAMQYHPDRNAGDKTAEQKFKEINEAYEVLQDPKKKAAYDQFGHSAFDQSSGGGGGFSGGSFNFNGEEYDLSDLFEGVFSNFMGGGASKKSQSSKGMDLRYDQTIDMEEATAACRKNISFRTLVKCAICDGTGSATKSAPMKCNKCNGKGKVRMQQGFFIVEQICGACNGHGTVPKDKCSACDGQGRVIKEKSIVITIPAGTSDGSKIRVEGEGEAGLRGAPSGDLYVFVSIKPHSFFKWVGDDLLCTVPIRMTIATLGGKVMLPTISGHQEEVTIAPGTQHGATTRIKGKGMPKRNAKTHGDMIVEWHIEIPINLSKKQKELLTEFEKNIAAESNPQCTNFLDKIKNIFKDNK